MKANIAVLPGDGIGPEVVAEALRVLQATASKHGHEFQYDRQIVGGASIDAYGVPLTDADQSSESDGPDSGAIPSAVTRKRFSVT